VRRALRLVAPAALALSAGVAVPAPGVGAQAEFPWDVKIEPDTRPRASLTELRVDYVVVITEKGTGAPPPLSEKWSVFAQVTDPGGGDPSEAYACGDEHEASPTSNPVPNGRYACTQFVDRGGDYLFNAIVNVRNDANPEATPVTLTEVSLPFTVDSDTRYTGDPDRFEVEGSFVDVAMLWGHGMAAGLWFLGALALAALVLPGLRKNLSSLCTYRLERRLDGLVKLTVATTALVTFTGVYLLMNQTAYETPFSLSALDDRSLLPYGRPYFLALFFKIGVYAAMVLATIPLVRAAWRQLRRQDAGAETSAVHGASTARSRARDAIWTGGAVAVAEPEADAPDPAPAARRTVPMGVRIPALVVLVGLPVILFCVTLLKYWHELIEASNAAF